MWSEPLLRVLARHQRVSYLPIWSCRHRDRLQLISFRPSLVHPHPAALRLCSTVTDVPPPPESAPPPEGVAIEIQHGLPRITVPLPSRNEPCQFTLKPVTNTIGDFLVMLQAEDHGIDRAVIRTTGGVRMASTTSIQTLLQDPFDLIINDTKFRVDPPAPLVPPVTESPGAMSSEQLQNLGDVRALVGQLYEALHVEEYNAAQEERLIKELESLQEDLAPLENQRKYLAEQAERRSNQLTWLGLGLMSVQFGILARLTWWEYSWDIMEPVTYFVTYGTAMACYAYFVLTKQDYLLPDVKDRQYLLTFHKRAKRHDWDVEKYNRLKDGVLAIERDLQRLRDPLRTKIGIKQIGDGGGGRGGILGSQVNIGNMLDSIKEKLKSS